MDKQSVHLNETFTLFNVQNLTTVSKQFLRKNDYTMINRDQYNS